MHGIDKVDNRGYDKKVTTSPRPPQSAALVVHLSFPSSVNYTPAFYLFMAYLETLIKHVLEYRVFKITRIQQ